MTFEDAQVKLLAHVRDRIRNGEFTEKGFARLIGISQPHAHNVLKGVRKLSPQIFDLILKYFHLSLLDLVPVEELQMHLQRQRGLRFAEVPFLDSPIGPGMHWSGRKNRRKRFPLPFPSVTAPPNLVIANLVDDPEMTATLAEYDIVLLDMSEIEPGEVAPDGLYAITRGDEVVLRYVRPGARVYYLVSDRTMNRPIQWEPLHITTRELIERLRARARWLGRESSGSQRGRFLYAPTSS